MTQIYDTRQPFGRVSFVGTGRRNLGAPQRASTGAPAKRLDELARDKTLQRSCLREASTLNNVVFALPKVRLARAFCPNAEKGYSEIRLKLLDWAITRALILGPPPIANRVPC